MSTSSGSGKSWDPFKTYQLSEGDRNLIERRAARKARNKAEFQKLITKPSRPLLTYDPALHRSMAYHAKNTQKIRWNLRNLSITALMLSPIVICYLHDTYKRNERHRQIMEGELTWKERCLYHYVK